MKLLLAAAVAFPNRSARAAGYPDRPVRIIVPFPAGATMDYVVRLVAARLTDDWGKPVVVENRTGGAGIIGTEAGAKAAPDGYTILAVANSFAGNPAYRNDLPYDTFQDFAPISLVGYTPLVLVGHTSLSANTTAELVALAKKEPGKIPYGAASGASPHLAMAWFQSVAGVKLQFVPYRGQAQAQTDLLSGQIKLAFGNLPDIAPHVKSGKLKAYGIALQQRSPLAPEIPTLSESGLQGYDVNAWVCLMTTGGTPAPIVERLSAEVRKILATPEVREAMLKQGLEPSGSTPGELHGYLRSEAQKWASVLKSAKVRDK